MNVLPLKNFHSIAYALSSISHLGMTKSNGLCNRENGKTRTRWRISCTAFVWCDSRAFLAKSVFSLYCFTECWLDYRLNIEPAHIYMPPKRKTSNISNSCSNLLLPQSNQLPWKSWKYEWNTIESINIEKNSMKMKYQKHQTSHARFSTERPYAYHVLIKTLKVKS